MNLFMGLGLRIFSSLVSLSTIGAWALSPSCLARHFSSDMSHVTRLSICDK